MATLPIEVVVGPQGRLVVPAQLRRDLGISPGDVLVASAHGEQLILEPRRAVLARIRNRLAAVPADVSLVAELLAERRAEAIGENKP